MTVDDAVVRIPLSRLAGACKRQLSVVRAEWPDGIPLMPETVEQVIVLELDIDWAAEKLLTAPALVEYERVRAQALLKLLLAQEAT